MNSNDYNPNDYNPDHADDDMQDVYTIETACKHCGEEHASHLVRGWTCSYYLCDACYKEELNKS